MTQDEKLKMFFDISMEDANKSNVEIVDAYKESLGNMFDEYVRKCREREEVKLRQMTASYRREKNNENFDCQTASRREVSELKNKYIEEIFAEVIKELNKFMETDAYKELLIKKIKEAVSYASDSKVVVYINASDEKYMEELMNMFNCSFVVSEKDIIGGIRCDILEKNISFDESFVSKISEAKQKFII